MRAAMPMPRAPEHFSISSAAISIASIFLVGCASTITLPPKLGTPSNPVGAPSIQLTYAPQWGTDDQGTVESTVGTAVTVKTVKITLQKYSGGDAELSVMGSASDASYGIREFKLRVIQDGIILTELIALQSPTAQDQVFPTLGIDGTNANGTGPGVSQLIGVEPFKEGTLVTAFALNFGGASAELDVNFKCAGCTYTPTGTPGIVVCPPDHPDCRNKSIARSEGAFVEALPGHYRDGDVLSGRLFTASIEPEPGHPDAHRLNLSSPSELHPAVISFHTGTATGLSGAPLGGAAFTGGTGPARIVVETFDADTNGHSPEVEYQVAELPRFLKRGIAAGIPIYVRDPSPPISSNPVFIRPRILFSPDGTLAVVVSAPIKGSSADRLRVSAYDLSSGIMAKQITKGARNVTGDLVSASVLGHQIIVNLDSPLESPVVFEIP
jgi:hypothetical protein